MKNASVKLFSFVVIIFIAVLVLIELYIGASWFSDDALYRVNRQEIVNDQGGEVEFQTKTTASDYYDSYSFEVLGDNIISKNGQIFMLIYQPMNQELEIYLNNNMISQYKKNISLQLLENHQVLFVPINAYDIHESNLFNLKIGSKYMTGLYKDIYFINEKTLALLRVLINISHAIKNFIIYGAIMLAIGFAGFSKIVVDYEDPARSKSYLLISISLIVFVLQSASLVNNIFLQNSFFSSTLFEGYMFICALTLFTLALYSQIKDNLMFKIFLFQLAITIISLPILILSEDASIIVYMLKLIIFILTALGASIYMNADKILKRKRAIINVEVILLLLLIGQVISVLNVYILVIPPNVADVITKIWPIAAVVIMLFNNMLSELISIREKNEDERVELKNLNTNIYEYVSEGVFSISDNLLVNDMYTKVCQNIFGRDISGVKIAYLIEDHETSAEFIEHLLNDIFYGKISWVVGVELLPTELTINDKTYELSYQKILDANRISKIIIKVSDRTDTRNLRNTLLYEKDKLNLSITSVMNREELLPLVSEFIDFMGSLNSRAYDKDELIHTIHTYKGNFGIFGFIHVLKALHELESNLLNEKVIDKSDETYVVDELYKDLEIITEITGSSFFEDTLYLKANVNNLESVYAEVKKYFFDTEASLIIFIIKKIFNKSIKDIILFYAREARKKAGERGKEIKTIAVTGDDIFIDYEYYKSVVRSLVHIFNNCIDHGIESEEERLMLGKPRLGEIQCRISDFGNFFEITIKDDGRGIAVERLAKRLIEKGILSQDELDQLTEDELMDYVFTGEISTQDETSLTSGRGVGLASVKNEVEKVGGEIRIVSFVDFGTEIKVLLPKENETLISYFSLPLLMDLYVEAFKIYIKSNNIFELPLNIVGSEKISEMYDYNVKIKFEGPEQGYFFMSCNRAVLWKLACYLTENINLTEAEFAEIFYDVIKETCNIVAGNSTSIFDLNNKYINILSPDEVDREYFDKGNLIYTWHMKYEEYGIILGLILD